MPRVIGLCFILTVALMPGAFAADPLKGETLAKRWCATCHIVSSIQQQGTTQAPPFSSCEQPRFQREDARLFSPLAASAHARYEFIAQRSG
jgi:hypothetical protein